jgi:CPA1 family monovalent cation:H+ antiporter
MLTATQLLIVLAVSAVTLAAAVGFMKVGVPTAVVFVTAGLIIGFLPFVPDVSLNPDLVLLGLLPLLVYYAAFSSSPQAFSRDALSIGYLAVGLVVLTAAVVAVVGHEVGHLSWPMAAVLGTAVGPTDPAAISSLARRVGLPRRLSAIIEGESLFNDGTALVLYTAAVAAATSGHFDTGDTVAKIFYGSAVGIGIGLAVGVVGHVLRRFLDDPPIVIMASLFLAYAAYIPAYEAGASGVLAAVTAGLYLGWHSPGALSAETRLQSGAFWETLVFLVDGALFILVGLSFHTFTAHARGPINRLVVTGALVVVTVIVVRLAWTVAMAWAVPPLGIRPERHADWRERLVVGWSGMRGAVTLAAVLAIPLTAASGAPLAGRDEVIYMGFAVILVTLVGQGLTLPLLVRRLGLAEHPSVAETERRARLELTRAALRHLRGVSEQGVVPDEVADALMAQYQARLRRLERAEDPDQADHRDDLAADLAVRRELLEVQRQTLLGLRDKHRVGVTTIRAIERELDLEEARLR